MQRAKLPPLLLCFLICVLLATADADAQETTVDIVVFRSPDSLTIYLPDSPFANLTGLYIEATTATGENLHREIGLLPAFRGLPYSQLPTPICFHLARTVNTPLPLDCQTITTLTQSMVDADVFWYDLVARVDRTLVLYLAGSAQICAAGVPRCTLVFPVLATPIPSATNLPTSTLVFTRTPIPLGYAGNPVTSNDQWTVVTRDFDGVTMVLVPAGCFDMGNDPDAYDGIENGQGVVSGGRQCFDEPFWIDRTEVTQGDFRRLGGIADRSSYFTGSEHPVEQITWIEARNFCALRGGQLPTEAEWEYAARGPSNLLFPWGNDPNPSNAVWNTDQTSAVGSIPAGRSWVGSLDMIGNVWEWTSSLPLPYPYNQSTHQVTEESSEGYILRGSMWGYTDATAMRASSRHGGGANTRNGAIGFRCIRSYP